MIEDAEEWTGPTAEVGRKQQVNPIGLMDATRGSPTRTAARCADTMIKDVEEWIGPTARVGRKQLVDAICLVGVIGGGLPTRMTAQSADSTLNHDSGGGGDQMGTPDSWGLHDKHVQLAEQAGGGRTVRVRQMFSSITESRVIHPIRGRQQVNRPITHSMAKLPSFKEL